MENRFLSLQREGTVATSPLELNCRVLVDHEKDEYLGRDAVESLCQNGPEKRIVGVRINADKSQMPQLGSEVKAEDATIGSLSNVGFSPTLNSVIGLVCLDADYAYAGMEYTIGDATAVTVSAPFIFNKSLEVRPQEDSYHTQ